MSQLHPCFMQFTSIKTLQVLPAFSSSSSILQPSFCSPSVWAFAWTRASAAPRWTAPWICHATSRAVPPPGDRIGQVGTGGAMDIPNKREQASNMAMCVVWCTADGLLCCFLYAIIWPKTKVMCGVGGFWEKFLLPFITIATAVARRVYTFAILSLDIYIFTSIMERTIYQYSRI